MSALVKDLLDGIEVAETWGIPEDQVAVTRVTVNGEGVPAASGALDWDYVRQYASVLDSGTEVYFYFSVSLDASVPPPDPQDLYSFTATVDVYSTGEHTCSWLAVCSMPVPGHYHHACSQSSGQKTVQLQCADVSCLAIWRHSLTTVSCLRGAGPDAKPAYIHI